VSHATSLAPLRQVAARCHQLAHHEGLPFARHLPAPHINEAVHHSGVTFRQRIFTPAVTLWTFLSQVFDADHSCRQAVARLLAFRVARGQPPCSPDTGAYCKARRRFPEQALAELVRRGGRRLSDNAERTWLWKGRPVKVVDGSGLSMPDTAANQKAYPKHRHLPPGVGFPLLRVVVVFSLAVGTVLGAALGRFQGKRSGELSLFRTLDDVLEPGDVVLGDRLLAAFWDVARLLQRGIDVVARMHAGRSQVRFRGRGHGAGNRRIWWRKTKRPDWMSPQAYDALPAWLRLRALRVDVPRRGSRTRRLVLVTTLTDARAYPAADVAALYRRRWQAELNLRSLKAVLQMDVLRGQTPDVVRKEVWAHLLVYNIVRGLMVEAARAAGVRPEEVSFTAALQTFNAFLPHLQMAATEEVAAACWAAMIAAMGRHRVGDRPDRYEPRAVKRRRKNYPRLRVPRQEARRRLREGVSFGGDKD
jgi:hypothetical protein